MNKIFISYRRIDSSGISGRIYDRLKYRFGSQNVFKDVMNLIGGDAWKEKITAYIKTSVVTLVIIGPNWLNVRGKDGNERLKDPSDTLRQEIELAFLQENMTVIPVLVEGAKLPHKDELPSTIQDLTKYQSRIIRDDPDFDSDMRNLIIDIEKQSGLMAQTPDFFDDSEPREDRQEVLTSRIKENLSKGLTPLSEIDLVTRGEFDWSVNYIREHMLTQPNSTIDLGSANLSNVNLRGASLRNIALRNAQLYGTNLSGADLFQADLRGADLRRSRMDVATTLQDTLFDTDTKIADIIWENVSLAQINWDNLPRLGDEKEIRHAKSSQDRIQKLQAAIRAYRSLSITLKNQGMSNVASRYRYREKILERREQLLKKDLLGWGGSNLVDIMTGYGEKPGRAFMTLVIVISCFTFIYMYLGSTGASLVHLRWNEALSLSITAFLGRGLFSGYIPLSDLYSEVSVVEGFIGLFVELILIGTFSRRFAGD